MPRNSKLTIHSFVSLVKMGLDISLYLTFSFQIISMILSLESSLENSYLPRKEVIHPHVPVGIPCYDLTPIICPTLDGSFFSVRPPASGVTNSRGLTGGVYNSRERIHRDMLTHDY